MSPGCMLTVIGVGNVNRGDDGIGITVARQVREQIPAGVCVVEENCDGMALLDLLQGATSVILIDAAQSNSAPGTIHRFEIPPDRIPEGMLHCSTHGLGVAEALGLAAALHQMPSRVILYGIEIQRSDEREGLSEVAERAAAAATARVLHEIRALTDTTALETFSAPIEKARR